MAGWWDALLDTSNFETCVAFGPRLPSPFPRQLNTRQNKGSRAMVAGSLCIRHHHQGGLPQPGFLPQIRSGRILPWASLALEAEEESSSLEAVSRRRSSPRSAVGEMSERYPFLMCLRLCTRCSRWAPHFSRESTRLSRPPKVSSPARWPSTHLPVGEVGLRRLSHSQGVPARPRPCGT